MSKSSGCSGATSEVRDKSYLLVQAVRYIRRMHGGSQSILVLCDDGNLYVVKMTGNPQGYNTLANELLGHQLIQAMGLPVPEYAFVRLSHAFVTAMYPDGWFQCVGQETRPEAGIHLGCRFVGRPDGEPRTSDYIGRRQVAAITNRHDFVGMLIVDAWTDHQDQRQAIFYSDTIPGPLKAVFIDHGMMFGGKTCVFKDDKCRAFYFDLAVYKDLWDIRAVDQWKSRLRRVAPEILCRSNSFIPRSWYDEQHKVMRSLLLSRLDSLNSLLKPYMERLGL